MAKIALVRDATDDQPRLQRSRVLARGAGWIVHDIVCSAGPHERPFEEQHSQYSISLVMEGTFQYRSTAGQALMIPGSVLLGNAGDDFECSHEHGVGDRCVSFQFSPEFLNSEFTGITDSVRLFKTPRLPPVASMSPVFSRASAALSNVNETDWETLVRRITSRTFRAISFQSDNERESSRAAEARITRVVRMIENDPGSSLDIAAMAKKSGLSSYHFLRIFLRLTGLSPHQYVRRVRLRKAAARLVETSEKVLEIALDCGFGDVSNFNRAFRSEFGVNPRSYRASPI